MPICWPKKCNVFDLNSHESLTVSSCVVIWTESVDLMFTTLSRCWKPMQVYIQHRNNREFVSRWTVATDASEWHKQAQISGSGYMQIDSEGGEHDEAGAWIFRKLSVVARLLQRQRRRRLFNSEGGSRTRFHLRQTAADATCRGAAVIYGSTLEPEGKWWLHSCYRCWCWVSLTS